MNVSGLYSSVNSYTQIGQAYAFSLPTGATWDTGL